MLRASYPKLFQNAFNLCHWAGTNHYSERDKICFPSPSSYFVTWIIMTHSTGTRMIRLQFKWNTTTSFPFRNYLLPAIWNLSSQVDNFYCTKLAAFIWQAPEKVCIGLITTYCYWNPLLLICISPSRPLQLMAPIPTIFLESPCDIVCNGH